MRPGLAWALCVSLGAVILLGIVDVWLWWHGGSPATITFQVREASREEPMIPLLVGLVVGMLLAHCFWSD